MGNNNTKDRQITITAPPEFKRELLEYCKSNDLKVSSTMRRAFKLYKHQQSLGRL